MPTGRGLEAWRCLHRRYDPATGSRKRVMLQALTNPERVGYDGLQGALERWKTLRSRYDKKKDQFGKRKALPESLAMNAMEKMVPRELELHLQLNYARFKTFEDMEEVIHYVEARTGSKLAISTNFGKPSASNPTSTPMDVDSLVKAVSGTLSSLAKGKGGGKQSGSTTNKIRFAGKCNNCGKTGHKEKDCWSKPASGGKGAQSRSNSASPKKGEKFAGKCNNCGKVGRKKADCWAPPKGKGKGDGKSNNKQSANALTDHPEPEPRPEHASGLEQCSLEICTVEVKSESPSPSRRSRRSVRVKEESEEDRHEVRDEGLDRGILSDKRPICGFS